MAFFIENTPKVRFGSLDWTKIGLETYKPYLLQTFKQTLGKPTQTFATAFQTFQTIEVCQKFGFKNYLSLLFIITYRKSLKMSKLWEFVSKPPLKVHSDHINPYFYDFSSRSKLPNLDFREPAFLKIPLKLFRQILLIVNSLSELFKTNFNG